MNFGLLGISFEGTPITVRERVRFTSKTYASAYAALENSPISELVILSTCNRTELYFTWEDDQSGEGVREGVENLLLETFDLEPGFLSGYSYCRRDFAGIRHLFEVAAGLRSQVVGEQQILGQVKEAAARARKYQGAGRYLNRIFREAVTAAKRARRETGLSEKNLSLSSVAVNFIERNFSRLDERNVLVIGVGTMSRIVLDLLEERGIAKIYATNRTHGRAVDIADDYEGVEPIHYSELPEVAAGVDIIISSTAAPHYVLQAGALAQFYSGRRLCIIDLGLPRDIEPDIGSWKKVSLYNLDHLNEKMDENRRERKSEAQKAEKILEEELSSLREWLKWQEVVPVIRNIKRTNSQIVDEELDRFFSELNGSFDREAEEELEKKLSNFAGHLSDRLFNRIILNMKENVKNDESGELLELLEGLFLAG